MTVNPFTFGNPILNPSDSQRLVIAFSDEGIEISAEGCQLAQFSNAGLGSLMGVSNWRENEREINVIQ